MDIFDDDDFFEDSAALEQAQATKSFVVDTTERMGMILDLLPVCFLIHQEQSILFANKVAIDNLGLHPEKHIGQHLFDFISEDQYDTVTKAFYAAYLSEEIQIIPKVSIPNQSGTTRHYQMIIAKLPWEGIQCVQIFLQDITDAVSREEKLKYLSGTDHLTKAQNRRSFIENFEKLLDLPISSKMPNTHCCALFDIDFFKKVNDQYGHEGGDIALIQTVIEAERILGRINLNRIDAQMPAILGRLGGEEFGIIIPNVAEEEAVDILESIRLGFEYNTIETKDYSFSITSSFGGQLIDGMCDDVDEIIRSVDAALYKAKQDGRNCIRWAKSAFELPPEGERISRGLQRSSE